MEEIAIMPKELVKMHDDVAAALSDGQVEMVRVRLTQLLQALARLPNESREANVAITEMISRISGFFQRLPVSNGRSLLLVLLFTTTYY
jgi:hypothetical protein